MVVTTDSDGKYVYTTVTDESAPGHISTLNPIRYRGYYYDEDLELYYLQSRYYDAEIGRFINADTTGLLAVSSGDVTDKNLFAYCDNNPVNRHDNGGNVWETVFDLVSLGFSIYDVVKNPQDPWAWAGVIGDAVDLIPFVTGVGESIKAIKIARNTVETADTIHDSLKTIDNLSDVSSTLINKTPVIGKMDDLNKYIPKPNEFKLSDLLPYKGTPKRNWKQNSSVLRRFADGRPIKDISPYPMKNAGFLGAERNLLMNRGYEYLDGYWIKKE